MDNHQNCNQNSDACECLKYIRRITAKTSNLLSRYKEIEKSGELDFDPEILDDAYGGIYRQNQELRAIKACLEKSGVPKDSHYKTLHGELEKAINDLDEFLNGVTDLCAKAAYHGNP
jgi:hypothetical protein